MKNRLLLISFIWCLVFGTVTWACIRYQWYFIGGFNMAMGAICYAEIFKKIDEYKSKSKIVINYETED